MKTRVAIALEVERNGASTEKLQGYLEREIKKIMARAQLTTPAAPKMLSMTIKVVDAAPPTPRRKAA